MREFWDSLEQSRIICFLRDHPSPRTLQWVILIFGIAAGYLYAQKHFPQMSSWIEAITGYLSYGALEIHSGFRRR
jgi:hypothetical protein